jgi:hypothetical protein
METLLAGLAIAAIGGLTWLAWHEHETFAKIHNWLQKILVGVIAFSLGYNVAVLKILYEPKSLEEISGASLAILITDALISPEILIIIAALIAYLLFC